MASLPRLEIHDTLGRRIVPLDKPRLTIGRRAGSGVHLTGADVSRDHAQIVRIDGRQVVRDHGSGAGTFVNAVKITGHVLSHGDRVRGGLSAQTDLVFLAGEAHAGAPAGGASAGGRPLTNGRPAL